jgi:hypothetical protein
MGWKSLHCLAFAAALVVGSPDAVDDHCTNGSCHADEQLALVQRQASLLHLSPKTPTQKDVQEDCSQTLVEDLDFAKASVIQNNLGNLGPDTGKQVLRLKEIWKSKDQSIDLVVSNTSTYTRFSDPGSETGKYHEEGNKSISINVADGTHVDLNFCLVKTGTDDPVQLHEVHFTLLDVDRSRKNNKQEKVTVSGLSSFVLAPDTEVDVSNDGSGTIFEATAHGVGCDNPTDPMHLTNITCKDGRGDDITTDQSKRSAMMVFKEVSCFDVTLEVPCTSNCKAGRNLIFAWTSALAEACKQTDPNGGGDPHMTNIRGQTYNLYKTGMVEFLRLPFESPSANANLTVSGKVEALPGTSDKCKQARYIKSVLFGGAWLEDRKLLVSLSDTGDMYTSLDGTHLKPFDAEVPVGPILHVRMLDEETFRLRAGKASIDVMSAGNHGGQHYFLNLDTKALAALNIKIGGVLGEDDITDVSTPPPGCQMVSQSRILTMKQDPGTSFAAARLT